MFAVEDVTKTVGAITAVIAMTGGGYTLVDKFGLFKKDILEWAPEHFQVSDAPANGEFRVVVARKKNRDDCEVTGFKLEVRDSEFVMHKASPSIPSFSGPASPEVDKFGYKFTIASSSKVATGPATLQAHIKYKCPEGEVVVNYPSHKNLGFNITKVK
jgi:hypothetical protein